MAVSRVTVTHPEEGLRDSLAHPHPESLVVAEAGLAEWGRALPPEDSEGLLEESLGRRVSWVPDKGWKELRA